MDSHRIVKASQEASAERLIKEITHRERMRTPSPRFVFGPRAGADACSTADALIASLSESIADRRPPTRRDVSPVGTLLGKRSMLPAQVWATQAKSASSFESIVTYPSGASINIKELSKVLIPLAQSNPMELPRLAEAVRRREHIQVSLVVYEECDAEGNGYLELNGRQMYTYVVTVFRRHGFLPPFSGQVKRVVEQFRSNRCGEVELLLEARECLCVVDAMLQALTFEARETTRTSEGHREGTMSKSIDHKLKNIFGRIESIGGNDASLPTYSTDLGSQEKDPNAMVPPARSLIPAYGAPFVPSSLARQHENADTSCLVALAAKVPTPREVDTLVDKAAAFVSDSYRIDHCTLEETRPRRCENHWRPEKEWVSPIPSVIPNFYKATCASRENAEKPRHKPNESTWFSSGEVESVVGAAIVKHDSHSIRASMKLGDPQCEDVTHQVLRLHEQILALDKEIEGRNVKIQDLKSMHDAERRQLNEEIGNTDIENRKLRHILVAKDEEIKSLVGISEKHNIQEVQSITLTRFKELKKQRESEIRMLEEQCREQSEQGKSQLEFVNALKKDIARLNDMKDTVISTAREDNEFLVNTLRRHNIQISRG